MKQYGDLWICSECEKTREEVEMGSPSISDEAVLEEIRKAEAMGQFITHQKYSQEEHDKFTKIIKDFNALYWQMSQQTWCNTKWRGVHILKTPTDLWIYQELITYLKPDLIIETGTCYGGSAYFMRDIMTLNGGGRLMTIDIDHSQLVQKIPGVEYVLGSSVSEETMMLVRAYIHAYNCQRVMVILDSAHNEEHVAKELELYAPLVSVGMPLIVEDTNNDPGPKAAVDNWFGNTRSCVFKRDFMCEKFMLTFNRDGFFERIA
jgi:cephalosporin hydroxylase